MKVSVNVRRCVSAGACVAAAPEVFDQDENGVVALRQERPDGILHGAVRAAAAACPSNAISVKDDEEEQ